LNGTNVRQRKKLNKKNRIREETNGEEGLLCSPYFLLTFILNEYFDQDLKRHKNSKSNVTTIANPPFEAGLPILVSTCFSLVGLDKHHFIQPTPCLFIIGLEPDIFVGTKLVSVYLQLVVLKDVFRMFHKICDRGGNIFISSKMIKENARNEFCGEALEILLQNARSRNQCK